MGEVAGAGLLAHVPTIMLPYAERLELNEGKERFGPYLMMIAALGEGAVTAPGRAYSEYENPVGTGQIHMWSDRPAGGWK
jgi:hypothetical protein